jgi:hypothetical protein
MAKMVITIDGNDVSITVDGKKVNKLRSVWASCSTSYGNYCSYTVEGNASNNGLTSNTTYSYDSTKAEVVEMDYGAAKAKIAELNRSIYELM